MLLSLILLSLAQRAPVPEGAAVASSLLATVPEDAYVLVHCRDFGALRARAERNDWYRLLNSSHGEPLLSEFLRDFQYETHSEMDPLLAMADELAGEAVFFDTGAVAGFVAEPPANREVLAGLMREWVPEGDPALRRTLELSGARVEVVAWPDALSEFGGWTGRAGHFAAFVDHPRALAIYSGDNSAAVVAALTEGLDNLGGGGSESVAPLVAAYLDAGGDTSGGVELFVDFTPFVDAAEAELKRAVEGLLPDPSDLLGLEGGTWLHASADVFPGTRIDCSARLHLPPDSLASQLADTFRPLPRTLPADLPSGVWGLWALNWNLEDFYKRARAAYEEAERGEGLATIDGGRQAAQGMSGVDPLEDVIYQLAGDFAFYLVYPPVRDSVEGAAEDPGHTDFGELLQLGFQMGLVEGNTLMEAFERIVGISGGEDAVELVEIAGADAYVVNDEDDFDGGVAFLPRTMTFALARGVLESSLQALTRVDGASLSVDSSVRAALDENAGVCFLACADMTPVRLYFLPDMEDDLRLPPLEEGQPARNPFDSQIISTARRTPDGFEFRVHTR
jgi:hypothetical protein